MFEVIMSHSVTGSSGLFIFLYFLAITHKMHCSCSSECPSELQRISKDQYEIHESQCKIDSYPCRLPVTSQKCVDHAVPFGDHGFSIQSISLSHVKADSFLRIVWKVPEVFPQDESRFPGISAQVKPTSFVIKMTIDNSNCISMTFTSEVLSHLKGSLVISCVKVKDSQEHTISYSTYVEYRNYTHLVHSREMNLQLSEDNTSISLPKTSNLALFVGADFVEVEFIPSYVNFSYIISVYMVEQGICDLTHPIEMWDVSPSKTSILRSSLDKYKSCETYCFQIASTHDSNYCGKNCIIGFTDRIYFHSPLLLKNCSSWNATLIAADNSIINEISVFFQKCCGFEHCFKRFILYLCHLSYDDCNSELNPVEKHNFEHKNLSLYSWKEKDLPSGKYCAKVFPENCFHCYPLNSNVVIIRGYIEPSSPVVSHTLAIRDTIIALSVATVLLITAILLSCFFVWKRIKRPIIPISLNEKQELEVLLQHQEFSNVTCLFLHTFDNPIRERTMELCEVVRKGTNVTVELCSENSSALNTEGSENWINPRLQFLTTVITNEAKGTIHRELRKVLVVESELAVDFQEYWSQLTMRGSMDEVKVNYPLQNMKDVIPFEYWDYEILFYHALSELLSKGQSLVDYLHLLVVHFEDITPRECKLNFLVPHKRYYLPRDIVPLCAYLESDRAGMYATPQKPEELRKALEQSSYFQCDVEFHGLLQ